MGDSIKQSGRRIFLGNTAALAVMQVVKYLFPLITLPYLARVLGADGYSVRAYVVAFMVFMQTILDFGFAQYGTKTVAENANCPNALSSINTNIYLAKTAMALVAGAITSVAVRLIGILSGNALFVAISFVSTAFKAYLPDYMLQGLEDMKSITVRYVVTQSLALVLIFVFIKSPSDLILVPVFEGLASLLSIIWAAVYLRRTHSVTLGVASVVEVKRAIKGSMPFFIAVAASSFMANTITVLMGVFPTSSMIISCWAITATVMQGIQALWQPVSRSLFPHMVKRRDSSLIKKLLFWGMPIVLIIVAVCYFAADFIMLVMGGEEYLEGAYIIRYVAPVLLFSYPISILGYPVIGALGRASQLSACVAIAGFAQLLFLIIMGLLNVFSIEVIIAARVASETLLCILECCLARRVLMSM
ncbi:oligosaccharide flippase family protein [Slackia heliotrinireducens]|uniref:oligosaccharide flippase family protein n=1 Tax=Slackia heliotrinireducens TaxID=84110 RepID=UPI0033158C3B